MTNETKGPQDQSEAPEDQASEPKASPARGHEDTPADPSRRTFFKRVAIGGGIALAGGGLTFAGAKVAINGRSVDDMDEAIKTDDTFKPKDQRDVILSFAASKRAQRAASRAQRAVQPARQSRSSTSTRASQHFRAPGAV